LRIDILTLFPEMFAPLCSSMLGRARDKGILEIHLHNIRDYSESKHSNTDDYPFGGGAGMVMMAQPIFSRSWWRQTPRRGVDLPLRKKPRSASKRKLR